MPRDAGNHGAGKNDVQVQGGLGPDRTEVWPSIKPTILIAVAFVAHFVRRFFSLKLLDFKLLSLCN